MRTVNLNSKDFQIARFNGHGEIPCIHGEDLRENKATDRQRFTGVYMQLSAVHKLFSDSTYSTKLYLDQLLRRGVINDEVVVAKYCGRSVFVQHSAIVKWLDGMNLGRAGKSFKKEVYTYILRHEPTVLAYADDGVLVEQPVLPDNVPDPSLSTFNTMHSFVDHTQSKLEGLLRDYLIENMGTMSVEAIADVSSRVEEIDEFLMETRERMSEWEPYENPMSKHNELWINATMQVVFDLIRAGDVEDAKQIVIYTTQCLEKIVTED